MVSSWFDTVHVTIISANTCFFFQFNSNTFVIYTLFPIEGIKEIISLLNGFMNYDSYSKDGPVLVCSLAEDLHKTCKEIEYRIKMMDAKWNG